MWEIKQVSHDFLWGKKGPYMMFARDRHKVFLNLRPSTSLFSLQLMKSRQGKMLPQAKRWMASQKRYRLPGVYVHNDSYALSSSPRTCVEELERAQLRYSTAISLRGGEQLPRTANLQLHQQKQAFKFGLCCLLYPLVMTFLNLKIQQFKTLSYHLSHQDFQYQGV